MNTAEIPRLRRHTAAGTPVRTYRRGTGAAARTVTIPAPECRDCGGTGDEWDAALDRFSPRPCPTCRGTGER